MYIQATTHTFSFEEGTVTFHWQRNKLNGHFSYIVYDQKMKEIAKGTHWTATQEDAKNILSDTID